MRYELNCALLVGLAAVHPACAYFAQPYSGTMNRPILFVHGVASNGYGTWGFERAECRDPVYTGFAFDHSETPPRSSTTYFLKHTVTCDDGTTYASVTPAQNRTIGAGDGIVYKVLYQGFWIWAGKYALDSHWAGRSHDFNPSRGWTDAWQQGITNGYKPNSSMEYLTAMYNLDTRFKVDDIRHGINHNGIEFFNLSTFDPARREVRDPWQHPREQAPLLFQKLKDVLTEYYPDWQTNPERKIDLVAHSQGGLVIRDAIMNNRGTGTDNPINHVNHIVTMDTPHLGTSFAHNKDGVPSMNRMRDWILFDFPNQFKFDVFWGAKEVNLAKESGLVDVVMELNDNAQHMLYPCGYKPPQWTPSTSGLLQGALALNPKDIAGPLIEYHVFEDKGKYYQSPYLTGLMGSTELPWRTDYKYPVWYWDIGTATYWRFGYLMLDNSGNLVEDNGRIAYDRTHHDCSEYLAGLAGAGYPTRPKGGHIPMTALSGAMNPTNLTQLIDQNQSKLLAQCDKNQFGIIDPNVVSGGACKDKVRKLIAAFKVRIGDMSTDWLPGSDFVVDVASQQGVGLFKPGVHPFQARAMEPINPAIGILHMHLGPMGEQLGIYGAAFHGKEIFKALENPPKARMLHPILSLLLN